MLTRIGAFLLVPFLVSDWTDNQWAVLCLEQGSPQIVCAREQVLPLSTQWREQILRKIETPPTFSLEAKEGIALNTSPVSAFQLELGVCPQTAVDPLYEFMSLQL